jgi:DNA-binding transcriptional LysR family regulator
MPWGSLAPPPQLGTGEVDLCTSVAVADLSPVEGWRGGPSEIPSGHHTAVLYDSGLASIVRKDHPTISDSLPLEAFCALDHVLVTEALGAVGIVDHVLSTEGLSRRIAARLPRHTLVGELIARTDMIATIDRRVAARHAERYGLSLFPPPVALPEANITMVWHERTDGDPARAWLRGQVLEAAAAVE